MSCNFAKNNSSVSIISLSPNRIWVVSTNEEHLLSESGCIMRTIISIHFYAKPQVVLIYTICWKIDSWFHHSRKYMILLPYLILIRIRLIQKWSMAVIAGQNSLNPHFPSLIQINRLHRLLWEQTFPPCKVASPFLLYR